MEPIHIFSHKSDSQACLMEVLLFSILHLLFYATAIHNRHESPDEKV